jgi:hypothetical protein
VIHAILPNHSNRRDDSYTADSIWVMLDPYEQDGIELVEENGDIVIYHVTSLGRSHIYTAKIQDP